MNNVEFTSEGIGHFISDNCLRVPIYQRPYAWEEDHVNDLFQDIKNSYPGEYFIGTIVVKKKEDYWEIIDGQQRLATIVIFYSSVRNFMKERKEDARANILQDYLSVQDLRTLDQVPKLWSGQNDNEFFRKNIVCEISATRPDTSKSSHERINQAYQIAYNFVKNEYDSSSRNLEQLFNLITFYAYPFLTSN